MPLGSRIVLYLSAVVLCYALLDHLLQRVVLIPSFEELEREEAVENLERVDAAIQAELRHIDQRALSWATREDTSLFARQEDPDYVRTHLGPTAMARHGLDLLYLCDAEGQVLWGAIRDPETGAATSLRDFPSQALSPGHRLLQIRGVGTRPWGGIEITERGPLLVASRPIRSGPGASPGGGVEDVPELGRVITGRFLGSSFVKDIESRARVGFHAWPLEGDLPEPEERVLDRVTSSVEPVVEPGETGLLSVWSVLEDTRQAPALLVRVDFPRRISERGAVAVRYALLSTIAAGLLLLFALLKILQGAVLRPIARLTEHAVAIGRSDDTSQRLAIDRADEIGTLAREFDAMLDKLERSRAQVVETARAAGMSEIATGILHNVGNVLNSVNVSAALVSDRLRTSRVPQLERLAGLVKAHEADLAAWVAGDPQGKKLAPFLAMLAEQVASERAELVGEAVALVEGIEHMRELVASQQSYASRSKLREPTALATQIEAALALTARSARPSGAPGGAPGGAKGGASGDAGGELEVVRQFEELPRIAIDRHKLLGILVNVIQNARQAMDEGAPAKKRLVLRLQRLTPDRVRIEVADNGVGIPQENLVRIFSHGFTTRKDGHGFGLHASANAATELGGSLRAASSGPGRGAIFTLELPLSAADVRSPEEAQAA